jgi:uncharacterized protein (TIGR02594 family)
MTTPTQPAWLAHAWTHLGISETAGSASTPDIVGFYRDAGHPQVKSDAVAWCAAFVGACLSRTGHRHTGSLLARSYASYGEPLKRPRPGALVVLARGRDPNAGHVGFWLGETADHIILLGGNQSDRVGVERFARDRLLAIRWPVDPSAAGTVPGPSGPDDPLFDRCLVHVLAMEGGYTDDPHDPGGPTNLGITLGTLAAWRDIPVTPESYPSLKAAVRSLDAGTARAIYQQRYWQPSSAAALPPALALMHFDASVNHGVAGAARLLQQALGVTVDGEIGPETLGAARTRPLPDSLKAYADARIARYRALPHFWRFGRGWLARVEKTVAAARTLHPVNPEDQPMTTDTATTSTTASPKWWGQSMTIWGAIMTALSTVLPLLGPLLGLELSADTVRDLGDSVLQVVQALGGLIGTALTIYGRLRAVAPLTRRAVSLRV